MAVSVVILAHPICVIVSPVSPVLIVKLAIPTPSVPLIPVCMGAHVMIIITITVVCVNRDIMERDVSRRVMMHVICIHVLMVEHVMVRVMVASTVIVQSDIPGVNVKHISEITIIVITTIHASMEEHVWVHHGPTRVFVRGVIRVFNVKRVSIPPLVVVTPVHVPMVAVVYP